MPTRAYAQPRDCARARPANAAPRAFTLVELLVVVSVIALLISILLPSLRRARDQAKLATCAANLRQIGLAIRLYADDNAGHIPCGPDPATPYDFGANDLATNQLWIGANGIVPTGSHAHEYNGLGPLIDTVSPEAKLFYCPADDNFNLSEEYPRIGTDEDAYGSYMYRQLDRLPECDSPGRIDYLGANVVDGQEVRVEALALDTNSLGPAAYGLHHTNHRGKWVNIVFRDASVRSFRNTEDVLAIPAATFADMTRIPAAIDQLLTNADFAYQSTPSNAPELETAE
jgi:prepilin-type N-terminal cleavage/methylation domain-containing protein